MKFTLIKLPFDAICIDGDSNFPTRAEALGSLDIEGLGVEIPKWGIVPGSVVIDIGAFVGDTAYQFAKAGATVHAFEPFFDAFVCMVYNTRNLPVIHYNIPVGNGEPVTLNPLETGANYGIRWVEAADAEGATKTFRIDDLNLPRVDFMKVDCEGSEIQALAGARETILRCRPRMFVEMYKEALARRGHTPEDLENKLKELGYSYTMFGAPPRWDWLCEPL